MSTYNFIESDLKRHSRIKRKLLADPGKHIPAKTEAKVLRKLMSQTGMNEEQLREHKKYRKMLSDSQHKENYNYGLFKQIDKVRNILMKNACKQTKLAKDHPKTLEIFREKLKAYKLNCGRYAYYL